MLVISLSDFVSNPAKYSDKAFSFEEAGQKWIVRPIRKNIFKRFGEEVLTPLLIKLGLKKRPLGILEGKASFTINGEWKTSPEELFDDIDDLNGSMKNFTRKG